MSHSAQAWHHHMPRRTFRQLMGCSPVLVLALAPVGCSANPPSDVVTLSSVPDAVGDVVVGGPAGDRAVVAAAPEKAITDITNTTIDHGIEVVTIEVAFKDLRPRQYLDVTAYVRTDRTGSRLPAQVTALAYRGENSVDLYEAGGSRCATAAVTVDYDINTLTMTVPRSCLDEPRWIQAEVTAATMDYDATPDDPHADAVWEDHAFRTGRAGPATGGTSPRLHHP